MRLISWNVNGRYGPALAKQIAAVSERVARRGGAAGGPRTRVCARGSRAWSAPGSRTRSTVRTSSVCASLSGREYRRIYFNLLASRWPLRRLADLPLEFPERYLAATVARDGGEFELHNAHLPPGSTRGLVKVEMFEALYGRLAGDQ